MYTFFTISLFFFNEIIQSSYNTHTHTNYSFSFWYFEVIQCKTYMVELGYNFIQDVLNYWKSLPRRKKVEVFQITELPIMKL